MRLGGILLAGCALGLLPAGAAQADTLRDALIRTYAVNPTLTAARARLRAIDEGVPIAKAAARPQAEVNASVSRTFNLRNTLAGDLYNASAQGDLSYSIYAGGRVRNGIKGADARVDAGRAELRGTEGDVFTQAVGAYMDLIRDEAIVELNKNQVRVLETNFQASKDRFEVGDLTRTDVAQSEARLALAESRLASAIGQATVSHENYERLIGARPGVLEPPPPLPVLPATPDAAVQIALAENPDVEAIEANVRAARYDVSVARADRRPTLGAAASSSYQNYLGSLTGFTAVTTANDAADARVALQARIPLYQGGGVAARVRQAQALQSQSIEQSVETERFVIANARATYASYQAALETIVSSEKAVSANSLALEGTRAENTVGTRTILDVLNAEQELLNSQVQLVTARRDAYVAGFALLNAMGQAEMRDLGLDGGPLYDPLVNYQRVRGKLSDWDDDPEPQAEATRTRGDLRPTPVVVGPPAPPPAGQ